jgi:hypothetical protein
MRWLMMLATTTTVLADTCLDIDTELWQVETMLQGDASNDTNGSSNNKTKHKTRKKQSSSTSVDPSQCHPRHHHTP